MLSRKEFELNWNNYERDKRKAICERFHNTERKNTLST